MWGWYYPVYRLLLTRFDAVQVYNFFIVFDVVLAYVFTYLYARSIGFERRLSAAVGMIFVFSGQVLIWMGTLPNVSYYYILPGALYFIERARQQKTKYLSLVASGVVLGIGWLTGHPQFVVYIHMLIGVYILFVVLSDTAARTQKRTYLTLGISLLLIFGVSLAVGYQQIIALLTFIGSTARENGVSVSEFFVGSHWPWDMIQYLLPQWNNPVIPSGTSNLYVGILPFVFLLFSFFVYKRIPDRLFRFFFWVFVFCLGASFMYSPLGFIFKALPITDSFRAITRIMFIGNFAAAIVIGFVLRYVITQYDDVRERFEAYIRRLKKFVYYIIAPVLIVVTVIKLFFIERLRSFLEQYFLKYQYQDTVGLPIEHYNNVINSYLNESLTPLSFDSTAVWVFVVFTVIAFFFIKRIPLMTTKRAYTVMLLIVLLNVSFVAYPRFGFLKREVVERRSSAIGYIQERMAEELDPFRVFSVFPRLVGYQKLNVGCGVELKPEDQQELRTGVLTPNTHMYYGIESIDGYDNFMSQEMSQLLAYVGAERATTGDLLVHEETTVAERVNKFIQRKNILRMTNTRYVISHFPLNDPGFKSIQSETFTSCEISATLYELQDYWPRFFLTRDVVTVADDDTRFAETMATLEERDDVGIAVITQSLPWQPTKDQTTVPLTPIQENDTYTFVVSLDEPALLHFGMGHLSGWRATIDGESVDIIRVNHAFMAVDVPTGEHTVVFEYSL